MSKLITTIILGLAGFIIVRVIAGFLDLEPKSLKIGSLVNKLPASVIQSTATILAAVVAIIIMIAWLALGMDDRIRNWRDDRPALASLPVDGDTIMRMDLFPARGLAGSVDLVVTLRNTNAKLIKYDADLRATVNEKDLDQPVVFSSFVTAGDKVNLIATVRDVPLKYKDSNLLTFEGALRYNLTYHFDGSSGTRRTSKLVKWEAVAHLTGQNGQTQKIQVFTKFFDQVEE
jgi:hypothetical protein